ncbi:hypothetical protein M8J75_002410 [Diaphorina citri]|nr:hypothetical protein M8J75_002410 [Diaphorina citri]
MLDTEDLLSFRVQYVHDCDPFSVYQSPEPTVPLVYKFSSSIPLVHQISALHRYLRAPHKISSPQDLSRCQTSGMLAADNDRIITPANFYRSRPSLAGFVS